MRRKFNFGLIIFVVLWLSACAGQFSQNNPPAAKARNVILLIGDGMGNSVLGLLKRC